MTTSLAGINHVALFTADLDRFIAFYRDVLGATVRAELAEMGLRHALVDVGRGATLHAFEVPGNRHGAGQPRMFDRGHLDHVALNVDTREGFDELRRRLVDHGACDGTVVDFGIVVTTTFRDPDGHDVEVALWQDRAMLPFEERIVQAA